MNRQRRFLCVALGATVLAGCGSDEEDEGFALDFSPDEPERRSPVPCETIARLEIGRTRDGYVLTVFGTAPGTGFGAPQLQARRDGRPGPDGFIDYDLLAVPPAPEFEMPEGTLAARAVRADLAIKQEQLEGVAGVRVHALRNNGQLRFGS